MDPTCKLTQIYVRWCKSMQFKYKVTFIGDDPWGEYGDTISFKSSMAAILFKLTFSEN